MITVKQHDTHEVQWKANMDLTGSSVRLIAKRPGCRPVILDATPDAGSEGVVTHVLSGELAPGTYDIELEVTADGVITTFPNEGYAQLLVCRDLD